MNLPRSAKKRRKSRAIEYSSNSDDATDDVQPSCSPVITDGDKTKTTPRSSERLQRKRNRSFTMPTRDDIWRNFTPSKSPTKYDHLRPKKLVNDYTRESNRYNYDPMYTSGEESMDDFIDDDNVVYVEDGESDKTCKEETTSESDGSPNVKRKKLKVKHISRSRSKRKKTMSSKDDETDTTLSDIDKEPAILHAKRLQDDSDSENETNKYLPTAKRQSRIIESESDEDTITDSIDNPNIENQSSEIPNIENSKESFEQKVSYDESKLGTNLNESDNDNFIKPSKKKIKVIVSDEDSDIDDAKNNETLEGLKFTNITNDDIKCANNITSIIKNSPIVTEKGGQKDDTEREIDKTQTSDCNKSTSSVEDTVNEVKYDKNKILVHNSTDQCSDNLNAVGGEVQLIEVGKNELDESMALAAYWPDDINTEDDGQINCNSDDRLDASNYGSSDDDGGDGEGESSSDEDIDYSNLSSRVRVGKLKQLKKKEKLFDQFRLSRQRRLSKENNKNETAI